MRVSKFKSLIENIKLNDAKNSNMDIFTFHNYIQTIKKSLYSKKIIRTQKPLEIFIELVNNCNLNCIYCYKAQLGIKDDSFMSMDIIKQIVKYLGFNPSSVVCLEGGEPLLHPNFIDIFYELKASKIPVDILTNGTLFDYNIVEKIASVYKTEYDSIQISLDGIGCFNDYNRGGDVNKILDSIKMLNEFGIKPSINCVVTNRNYKGIIDLIKYLQENYKLSSFSLNSPIGKSLTKYILDDDKSEMLFKEIESIKEEISFDIFGTPIKSEKECENSCSHCDDTHMRCTAMRSKMCISTNGNVYPCVFLESKINPIGNLFLETLEDIWNSKVSNDYVKTQIEKSLKCSNCSFGKYCYQKCAGELI